MKKKLFNYSVDLNTPAVAQAIEELLKTAIELHQRGNFEQAEKIYREIIAKYPDHSDALNLLGAIESKYKRHEIAERLILKAISINPAISRYHNNLGMVYIEIKDWELAEEYLIKALKICEDQIASVARG